MGNKTVRRHADAGQQTTTDNLQATPMSMVTAALPSPLRSWITDCVMAILALGACAMSLACLSSCTMKDHAAGMSTDVGALQKIVRLDMVPASVKWERFSTPEYTGGVPGPTDFVTLVAELTPPGKIAHGTVAPLGKIWIAPKSARPWMAASSHALLDKLQNSTVDLSQYTHCRAVQATLTQTGQPVKGFACNDADKLLLYLTIADYTAP
jgi:hypothetical protein